MQKGNSKTSSKNSYQRFTRLYLTYVLGDQMAFLKTFSLFFSLLRLKEKKNTWDTSRDSYWRYLKPIIFGLRSEQDKQPYDEPVKQNYLCTLNKTITSHMLERKKEAVSFTFDA